MGGPSCLGISHGLLGCVNSEDGVILCLIGSGVRLGVGLFLGRSSGRKREQGRSSRHGWEVGVES